MRNFLLLLFVLLLISADCQTPYTFTRNDTIVVKFNNDTFDLAWAGGINYAQFSNIDLNFDGKPDVFAFDRTGNKTLCFLNVANSSGQIKFRYAPEYESSFPPLQNWALLKDFNCDGLPDIFTNTPGGIRVYKNTSSAGVLNFTLFIDLLRSNQLSNYVNIYVSSVDLPGIEDIDGDGDLDILTFGVFGTSLEYHRNYSVENGFGCDSLQFTMRNQCWGCFSEDLSTNGIYLNDTCNNSGISNPELGTIIQKVTEEETILNARGANRHSGSCTTILDVDGDGMKDLVLGDVSFGNMVMVRNGGTVPNTNQCMDSVDLNYPSYDTPVNMSIFPCAYLVDVNNDGVKDLVVTPQGTGLSENKRSVLFYENIGTNLLPDYNFVRRDLFQVEMIERGEGAYPVLADYNGDGLLDLFVANYGAYNSVLDQYVSQLALYINVGSSTNPVFNLVTENFASLDLQLGIDGLFPTFGDLDNDGDDDMIVGNENGTLSYFLNTAGAGNPYNFALSTPGILDFNSVLIDIGQFSAPVLVDIDRDGDLDLVIGTRSGKLSYYRNDGTPSVFSFRYITDFLGNVNVKEWWDNTGYSVPTFIDSSGNYQLFIGSKSGFIHHYDNIDGNLIGAFNLVDSTVFEFPVGIRTTCAMADLTGDGSTDMIVGNYRGGLTFYIGDSLGSSSVFQHPLFEDIFTLFPNPATDQITLLAKKSFNNASVQLLNAAGQLVEAKILSGNQIQFDLYNLADGLYIVTINLEGQMYSRKFIRNGKK